ncbi:hypothetical protein [Actinophytocola oryzae]|uniref:Uncharacterized protein n=1 Tax=Actinophytocola oryzae TaxID=502181 RepID=A0A4R7W6C4_9PSEU|nr:hypothetical protein [Actinophytocola oryzae]TDV57227.1 hypothetical protein CLV71_10198 [Actinophytocola oryzae]
MHGVGPCVGARRGLAGRRRQLLAATSPWAGASSRGLAAIDAGDAHRAAAARDRMDASQAQALQLHSVPGENRVEGVVRIGDGVVDVFLDRVRAAYDASLPG